MNSARRPRILVSNDDGIHAPGLRSLVKALSSSLEADVYVCSPSGERSAQSMSITMGKSFAVFPIDVPGAKEAYAVDGSPADTVMLGLNAPIWSFDEEEAEAEDGDGEREKKQGGEEEEEEEEEKEAPPSSSSSSRVLRRLSSAGGSGNGSSSRRTLKHARSFSEAVEEAMVELKLHSATGDDDDDDGGGDNDADGNASAPAPKQTSLLASSSFYYPHSRFDLVVSGTNKGDNLGHHCWYSGTVGAAREGALSALPSVAFSLDDHFTREIEDYHYCSEFASAVVSAVLGLGSKHRRALMGHVLNVNFPSKRKCARRAAEQREGRGGGGGGGGGDKVKSDDADGGNNSNDSNGAKGNPERMRAIALTTQGGHCWRPGFDERYLRVEKEEEEAEDEKQGEGKNNGGGGDSVDDGIVSPRAVTTAGTKASEPATRYFKNVGGGMWEDRETAGTDSWAVDKGMASVVVLGLKQHALTRGERAHVAELEEGERATEAGKEVVERAAELLKVEAVLLPGA